MFFLIQQILKYIKHRFSYGSRIGFLHILILHIPRIWRSIRWCEGWRVCGYAQHLWHTLLLLPTFVLICVLLEAVTNITLCNICYLQVL